MQELQTIECCNEKLGEIIAFNQQVYTNKHNQKLQVSTMLLEDNIFVNYKCPICGKEFIRTIQKNIVS